MRLRLALACLLLPLLLWAALPLLSSGQSLDEIQRKIDATEAKIGRKKGTEGVLTTDITAYNRRISALQSRIGGLRHREARLTTELDRRRAELSRIQADLRSERARLARLRVRLVETRAALADRLVELYKADEPDLITVVLNANGFADLLERREFLRRISDADRRIVSDVRAAKRDATETSRRLARLEDRKQAVAELILERTQQVHAVKQQLIGTRVGYERTRAGKQAALRSVRADRQNLEGDLTALRAAQERVQARLARLAADGSAGLPAGEIRRGSGGMVWPVNGPITSPFCETRAWESCHPGIDIGVPSGTPIRAAASGRVVLMQPDAASGGYGNFTCVQHTSSMSTCYAHQSRFATSTGAEVSQGQVIGYVGCTGRCFGDHLHFEVRINGSVTNPLNYL